MGEVIGPLVAVIVFIAFCYFTTIFLYSDKHIYKCKRQYYRQQYKYHIKKAKEHKRIADEALQNYNKYRR